MRKAYYPMLLVLTTLVFTGCASRQPQVAVAGDSEKTITMNADSFKFEPNNIKANRGDTIVLNIVNVSDTKHNFTIKDPRGNVLQSVDLPAKRTVPLTITLPENGTYDFYCDKPFHPTMGMKGSIQVGGS